MTAQAMTDPDEFAAAAEPILAADPPRGSVIATALHRARHDGSRPGNRWWIVRAEDAPGGPIVGLAMLTRPGRPYLLADATDGRDVGTAVAAELDTAGSGASDPEAPREPITGVNGFVSAARGFATEWVRRHGGTVRAGRQDVLHALPGPVRMPHHVPGAAREATVADHTWLDDWGRAFIRDIGDPPDPLVSLERPLADGGFLVWESELDGRTQPAAMAFANPPQHGHVRISWVWTLPEARGRGFGGAVVAAAAARAQADGLQCLLIADASNPVSNAVYRRLGFQPVDEACHLHIEDE